MLSSTGQPRPHPCKQGKTAAAADLSNEKKKTFLVVEGGPVCEQQRETLGGVIRVHFLSGFPYDVGN